MPLCSIECPAAGMFKSGQYFVSSFSPTGLLKPRVRALGSGVGLKADNFDGQSRGKACSIPSLKFLTLFFLLLQQQPDTSDQIGEQSRGSGPSQWQ